MADMRGHNKKFTDRDILAIHSQYELITEAIEMLKCSRMNILNVYKISPQNYYVRRANLIEQGLITLRETK